MLLYPKYLAKITFPLVIREDFVRDIDKWGDFYGEREPHKVELPEPWNKKLNDFQRMILLRTIRPDKVRFTDARFREMYADLALRGQGQVFMADNCH